jgi:putative transposase
LDGKVFREQNSHSRLVEAGVQRETDRDPVPTVAKRHVSEQSIYTWKKRLGSFQPDDVRRLKQLEQEDARLKKLVAERDLEIEVMKEIAVKNSERAGPSRAGGLWATPRAVATKVVHAAGSGAVGAGLPLGEGGEGWAGAGAHGGARRAVPTLWLPSHPHLPRPRRPNPGSLNQP